MQFVNKNVPGHPEVGHIDLLSRQSYIEVPENDAERVARALSGVRYKGREVRCNDADEGGHGDRNRGPRSESRGQYGENRGQRSDRGGFDRFEKRSKRNSNKSDDFKDSGKNDDWKQFFHGNQPKLKGDEPDFTEEGWAKRKPRKK
jgi:ATP-dependent RNA helicase DeaD